MGFRIYLLVLIITACNIYAQETDLIGTWQIHDTLIKAGMGDTYRFYKNGSFNFDFGSFNFNARFINISGKYLIKSKTLTFEVEKMVESKGGEISFGDNETDYNSWTIVGDKYETKKLSNNKIFNVSYKLSQDKKILTIDDELYYRISNSPNAERDTVRFPLYRK
jgi:hypothetical protein